MLIAINGYAVFFIAFFVVLVLYALTHQPKWCNYLVFFAASVIFFFTLILYI